jgi:hypothetical protein
LQEVTNSQASAALRGLQQLQQLLLAQHTAAAQHCCCWEEMRWQQLTADMASHIVQQKLPLQQQLLLLLLLVLLKACRHFGEMLHTVVHLQERKNCHLLLLLLPGPCCCRSLQDMHFLQGQTALRLCYVTPAGASTAAYHQQQDLLTLQLPLRIPLAHLNPRRFEHP